MAATATQRPFNLTLRPSVNLSLQPTPAVSQPLRLLLEAAMAAAEAVALETAAAEVVALETAAVEVVALVAAVAQAAAEELALQL